MVPILLHNSLKLSESNCFPLSTVRVLGTPNLQIMFYQKNFFTISDLIVASGLALIHLVKYFMATTMNLFPPCDGGSGPTRSMPHLCKGQVGGMSCTTAEGFDWCGEVLWHAWHVLTISSASLMCVESLPDGLHRQCPRTNV